MKRSILSALLTAILLLGLTACGGKAEPAAEPAGDASFTGFRPIDPAGFNQ